MIITRPKKRYRIACLVAILFCVADFSLAQIKPNSQTQPGIGTQTLNSLPADYGNSTINLIRVWDAQKPYTSDSFLTSAVRTVQEVKQTTQYFDGLGRPLQTVAKAASPNGFDMVSPVVYDPFGREMVKYLPYVGTNNNGQFQTDAFTQQDKFMKAFYNPTNDVNGEKYFYSKTDYEPSPLNRPSKTYAPGNNWVGDAVGVGVQYLTNDALDSVCIWDIGFTSGNVPTYNGYYGGDQLFENTTTDEGGNKVIEYKDKEGHIILKKVQFAASPSQGSWGWYCTYYVYDDLGSLRFVIQPKAADWLKSNSWIFDNSVWKNSNIAKELCFSYEYDNRHRMIVKRVPGAGEMWMVYDFRDRLIMTQDSSLRAHGNWLYTDYDSLNRPVVTGIWTTTGDRAYHQNLALNSITYPAPASGYTILSQTYYDDYSWVSGSGSGLSSSMITTYNTNTSYFYTPDNTTFPFPQSIASTPFTRGMVTGTKVNVIGSSTNLFTVDFYNDRGRVQETQSTNYSGGKDTIIMQYSFTGQVLRTLTCHGKAGTNPQSYKVLTKNFYDAAGRVTAITKKMGNSLEDSITVNKYNELGQLVLKKIGLKRNSLTNYTYTSQPLDTLRYAYNIRGWLRGINKDYARNENSAINWFGEELSYDFGFTATALNGNIAGIRWRNGNDGKQRAYGFAYDAVNRLTKADFTQYVSGTTWDASAGIDYSVHSISYDQNGNILTMNQMGLKLNTSSLIDSLVYNYNINSNKLNYVTDKKNDTSAHLGDFTEMNNNTTQDYWYDGNGNFTKDNNKNISGIAYNYLNLPNVVTVTNKGTITYTYDAAGNKLKKVTAEGTKTTTTLYLGAFNYVNDTLQFVMHEEGRARPSSFNDVDTFYYDYLEKDHLGNVRVVLTDQKRQDVYPAATLEKNANAFNTEQDYYDIKTADTIGVSRIASWNSTSGRNYLNNNGNPPYNNNPYANTSAISSVVYKLNGASGDKTGLGITLKVMAGDAVDIYAKSFWHSNGANPSNNYLITAALATFINAFAGTSAVANSEKGATAAALNGSAATTGGLNSWLGGVPNPSLTSVPKAYINWILFDEQFKPVSSGSNYDLINTTSDAVKNHHRTVSIASGGYLYVYCSNESNTDVFFDNLQVIHTRGALLETTDYYPFGLTMSGISSKALNFGGSENKNKFNDGSELQNKEFSDGSGLELYDATFRMYDAQIGRFHQIDPLGELSEDVSPYTFAYNNPILLNDPLGLAGDTANLPPVIVTSYKPKPKPSPAPSAPTSLPADAHPGLVINSPQSPATNSQPPSAQNPLPENETPWMDDILNDVRLIHGVTENNNPTYGIANNALRYAAGLSDPTEYAWCSAYACYKLNSVECNQPHTAASRLWTQSSTVVRTGPNYGAIAVFRNYADAGLKRRLSTGHIGFLYGITPDGKYIILGGNQGNTLKFSTFSTTSGYIKAIGGYMHLEGFYFPNDYHGPTPLAPVYQSSSKLNTLFGIISSSSTTR